MKMSGLKIRALATLAFASAFALAGCVSQQTYEAQVQKTDALQDKYNQLNQQMSSEIAANEMHIERLQNALRVTINDQLLFPSGDWQMPADAQQSIAKIAKILAPMQQTRISVNGYTDNVPIGPGLMRQGVTSNLILSQKRAENVAQFMIAQGVNPSLITTQGFGDANPVASNDTAEGRAQNRRVELVLAGSGN
jgi:chemotaxis protein MotB